MVTTRGGTETPGAPTPTPVRSSTRKTAGKRELESLETPTQAKRQRKTAPPSSQKKQAVKTTKEPNAASEEPSQESADASDANHVVAPSVETPQTPAADSKLPVRRRESPQVVIARTSPDVSTATESFGEGNEAEIQVPTQSSDFHTPMQAPGSVYATPATTWKPRDGSSPTPKAKVAVAEEQISTSSSAKKGRGRPKKTPQKATETPSKFSEVDEIPSSSYQSDAAPILSQEWEPPSAQPEKTHTRFGSEEPAEVQDSPMVSKQGNQRYEAPQTIAAESTVETAQVDDHDDDASDSDDEAPEVVTTAAASSKAQAAQAEATRAQQAQLVKEGAKRKAREDLIAAQQAAKRSREEKKAKKLAKKAAKEAKTTALPEDDEQEPEAAHPIDVNGLLPTSLLEIIDDQRPPTPPPTRRGKTEEELRKEKLNHHIKFLERTEKGPKDVKKGKLSVAVLAQQNRVLPPKMNRQTKNVREHWLKGRQQDKKQMGKGKVRFGKVERRAHRNGEFLRNGEE